MVTSILGAGIANVMLIQYFCSPYTMYHNDYVDSSSMEEQKWQQRERQDELAVLKDHKHMRNVGYVKHLFLLLSF